MRKLLSLLLAVAMVLSLTACGTEDNHDTPTTEPASGLTEPAVEATLGVTDPTVEETQPTVTTPVTDETEPTGPMPSEPSDCEHEPEVTLVEKSTCTDSGRTESTCTKCGEVFAEETPPVGHNFGSDGQCSRCGEGDPNYNEGSIECDHDHRVTSKVDATCTKSGQIIYGCSNCPSTYTDTIPMKEHDYAARTCTKPSICKLCGSSSGSAMGHSYGSNGLCGRCGAKDPSYKEESVEPGSCAHSYSISNQNQPTCTKAGSVTYSCGKCGDQYTEAIAPNGHDFAAATCEAPQTCRVCAATQGSALGHSYGSDFHCTRCGAKDPNAPTDVIVTVRSDKGVVIPGITVSIYTGSKSQPDGTAVTNSSGQVTIRLKDISGGYRVILTDVPAEYIAKDNYSYSASRANITLASASIITPTDHSKAGYKVGSTMGDFTLTDTDGNSYSLSELLQENKLVVLNFWYTACDPCKSEFPHLESVYQKYKDDLVLLALDPLDNESSIRDFKEANPYSFPMLQDTIKLAQGFNVIAYPTTVIIDSSGTIRKIEVGAYASVEAFESVILRYLY